MTSPYLKLDDLRAIVAEAVDQHDTFTRFLVRLQQRLDEMASRQEARLGWRARLESQMVTTEPFGVPHLPAIAAQTVSRTVTPLGVRVCGQHFDAPELRGLVGQAVLVDVPAGPLPAELHASFEARPLVLRRSRGWQQRNGARTSSIVAEVMAERDKSMALLSPRKPAETAQGSLPTRSPVQSVKAP